VQDSSAGADGGKRLLSRQEMDALGNLKSVRNDDWAGGNSWTQVAEVLLLHDVEGQLLVVTPSIGITLTTVITYDLAGRKTGMRDPDLGVWGYTYSKQGALLTQSDARNCLTTLAYDLKGRVVSKVGSGCTATGTDTTGYTVNFGYFAMGSALGSSGQSASVGYSDNRFRHSLTYGGDGLLNGQTVTVTGLSPVTLAFGYDGYDRPTTTSYPALGGQPAEVVTTAYADTGQPMTLTSSLSGVIGVLRYDAYRRPVTLTYSAGGVAQVWGYYAFNSNGTVAGHGNTEGRLASLKVGTGALNQPHFTYSYDRFGNLETITDAGAPNTFTYDLQNRLTTAYGKSYSYDGIGRLTNYEGTALIAFGAYGRRTTSAVYTDDAVGNLTGRLSEVGVAQTLKWNHENRLVEVKSSNLLTETYGYDEAGQRVKRTTVAKVGASNVTTTTYYLEAGQEVQNGVPVRYYTLGGNTLGVRQGANVSWLYGDHLGSTSASSGAAATSERYYAYGKDRGTKVHRKLSQRPSPFSTRKDDDGHCNIRSSHSHPGV
jgi:YD repeat-containing protein